MQNVRLLLLGLWLGAAIFFSAVVAPAAFRVMLNYDLNNAREVAGALVTRTLSVINTTGFVTAIFLLITAFLLKKASKGTFYGETLLLALTAGCCAIGQWIVSPKMVALRTSLPQPIDQVARDHPTRIAFDNLHQYSVALLTIAMLASLIAFFLIARRRSIT
ncbi:MAG: hypothetical protein QOE77_269 [Blastocatellia bacterium]|jgi:hypothetical protein|nr:hypothetical protein [Blastocatellia bacterium]